VSANYPSLFCRLTAAPAYGERQYLSGSGYLGEETNICDLEEWRSFAQPFFDVIPTGRPEEFRARACSRKLGPLVVSEVGFDAAIFDRDPGRLRGFGTEYLLLETYDKGVNRGRSGDLVTGLDAGAVHIFDMARPWRTQSTAVACRSVVIPYDVVCYDPGRAPRYARLSAGSPRNAMVLAGMAALFEACPQAGKEDAAALADSFGALVRRLMFDQQDEGIQARPPNGNGLLLRKYIDTHLDDPGLGPRRLCEAFGISRASLYRSFPEGGGVRGYITGRRLDRCFGELMHGPQKRGRVREVAAHWGFFDAKNFNRAFRHRFGIAPSDCLGQCADMPPDTATSLPVKQWMRRF
jgi:AraC-like DNA-binding protein